MLYKSLKGNLLISFSVALTVLYSSSAVASDPLLTLKNLERERARFLQAALNSSLEQPQKEQLLMKKTRHLIDMERMVIRDERLASSGESEVTDAFTNYEMTFVVHAAAEKKTTPLAHWIDSIGLSSNALQDAEIGYRR